MGSRVLIYRVLIYRVLIESVLIYRVLIESVDGYLSLCVKESKMWFGIPLLCFGVPPFLVVRCLSRSVVGWTLLSCLSLEFVMSFLFNTFGFIGCTLLGLGALATLFDFPTLECLILVSCGGLLSASSIMGLTALEN